MRVVRQDELPFSRIAREFVGDDQGGVGVCMIFVEAPPGRGPSLHRHPYDEVFVVQEGQARFVAGEVERDVGAGDIVVAPAGTPHCFKAIGDGTLTMLSIQPSSHFDTEWLE